jgi:glycosyltransferase involved in cell wall biosynthesis
MRVLFIHQNCPGQYKHLSRVLAAEPENEVVFITQPGKPDVPGVRKVEYKAKREPARSTHYYIRNLETGVLNGQAVARAAVGLKKRGFVPDIVCAHPGWGESLYIKDIYPDAPLLNYFEFYYKSVGSDVDFDPAREATLDDLCRVRTKNCVNLLSLEACDRGISPTRWQRAQFPKEFINRIAVIHDGVDMEAACPKANAALELPNGTTLTRDDEVVTYVARNLEPYRGFPTFMHMLEESCRRRPNCHYVVLGGDGVSYGAKLPEGKTYREEMLSKVTIDPERVHFMGRIPYNKYMQVLQVSSVHVYLTYPFVLSWSMLEAMAAGCLVVASETPPVTEVIEEGRNGLLVDFFAPKQIADRVDEVFAHKDGMAEIRARARKTVRERYELQRCLQRQLRLINDIYARQGGAGSGTKPAAKPARRRAKGR